MSCERYRDALTDAAAGGPVPAGLEAHLASCEVCRRELAALRQALALADTEMARLVAVEPSPGLSARIREAVAESGSTPAWRFGWLWPVAAAAATLLVALAVWVGRAPSPGPPVAVEESRVGGARNARVAEPPATEGRDPATPKSSGPTARGGVRQIGGSLGTRPVDVPRDRAAEPEVLVPPGGEEALLRFAAHLHRRTVTPDSLLVADLGAPMPEPKAIEIPPLVIVPLDPADDAGTD